MELNSNPGQNSLMQMKSPPQDVQSVSYPIIFQINPDVTKIIYVKRCCGDGLWPDR